jgi:hypothetical protein
MVCTELPDSSWDRDGELAAVIRSAMINGPYAGHNSNAAVWHIFEFLMHEKFLEVYRLQVHMPHQHQVYFDDDVSPGPRNRMEAAMTNLLDFFRYNAHHAGGRQHRYPEFPGHFVYRDKWWPRKKGNSIGRMYQSNPSQEERFYLRRLLTASSGVRRAMRISGQCTTCFNLGAPPWISYGTI